MRFLTAEQELLTGRLSLDTIPIVVITSYSVRGGTGTVLQEERRRAPWTVSKQWAFSDTAFQIGNLDVQPYLVSMTPYSSSINATPEDARVGSGLLRNMTLTLRNGVMDSGVRMIEELRANDIQQADIMIGQLSVNRDLGATETGAAQATNLGELAVFYRGAVQQVGPITNDAVQLFCNSHTPFGGLGQFVITEGTADTFLGDIRSTSATIPTMLGNRVQRIPGLIWSMGFQTTLQNPLLAAELTAAISGTPDPTITPATGDVWIGGELCSYGSFGENTIGGLVRNAVEPADHAAGEIVSFVPDEVAFVTAVNGFRGVAQQLPPEFTDEAIREYYVRNPGTGDLMLQPDDAANGSITPQPPTIVGYVVWDGDDGWKTIVDAMAESVLVKQQAQYGEPAIGSRVDNSIITDDADDQKNNACERGEWQNKTADAPQWVHGFSPDPRRELTRIVNASDFVGGFTTNVVSEAQVAVQVAVVNDGSGADLGAVTAQLSVEIDSTTAGTFSLLTDTTTLTAEGNHQILGPLFPGDGVSNILELFEGQEFRVCWPQLVEQGAHADQYVATVELSILFFPVTVASDTPLTVPAQIGAAGGGAGIATYLDSQMVTLPFAPATEPPWEFPGMSLHQQSLITSTTNCTATAYTTAWRPYLHIEATASTGTATVEMELPSGMLDMSPGTPPADGLSGWMGHQMTNIGTAEVTLRVSDELVPVNSRTFTDATPSTTFDTDFTSEADTLTPVLTDVRNVRIEITNLSIADTTLDVWWCGPTRAFQNVWSAPWTDGWPEGLSHPADLLRWFLWFNCFQLQTNFDEASMSELVTNLGATKEAQVLSSDWGVGADHVAFLLAFGRDHRFQAVTTEIDANTVFRFFATDTSYAWPAASATITLFQSISELGVDGAVIMTRRTFGYNPDRANPVGTVAWRGAYLVSSTQNDISGTVTTQDIIDQEELVGQKIGPDMFLPSVVDDASAEDIAGFYFEQNLTGRRIFRVSGVPWPEGYALELNDVISITPPWYTTPLTLRIIETVKNWSTELVDFVGVETT